MRVIDRTLKLTRLLSLAMILAAFSVGCGPPSSQGDGQQSAPGATGIPELTDEVIRERINYTRVRDVLPENANANLEPISWGFDEDEPKEITVVERQIDGTRATLVLDIKTSTSPRSRLQRRLAGQIRTEWELRTGWVLRRWEIVRTENISMKYHDLPPASPSPTPPGQSPNR